MEMDFVIYALVVISNVIWIIHQILSDLLIRLIPYSYFIEASKKPFIHIYIILPLLHFSQFFIPFIIFQEHI